MEKLIEKTGSFGRFQKLILCVIGPVSGLCGLAAFVSVFNSAFPKLICKTKDQSFDYNETLLSETCEIIKNISLSQRNQIESPFECYYDEKYYGITIVTEWNLICKRIHLASLTQTVYMIGSFFSIFSGILSDKFGRKKVNVLKFQLSDYFCYYKNFSFS